MADRITKEQRRKTMQSIKAKSQLENTVSKALWKKGYRFRKNVRSLFGTPDIAIQKYKIVIFIDSCFWHGCPIHGTRPKTNQEFWDKKLKRNKERDTEVTQYYKEENWNIMRVWEQDIKNNFEKTIDEIAEFIQVSINKTEKKESKNESISAFSIMY